MREFDGQVSIDVDGETFLFIPVKEEISSSFMIFTLVKEGIFPITNEELVALMGALPEGQELPEGSLISICDGIMLTCGRVQLLKHRCFEVLLRTGYWIVAKTRPDLLQLQERREVRVDFLPLV